MCQPQGVVPPQACYYPQVEGEPMGTISGVVRQPKKERTRLADELHRVTAALTAFGNVYLSGSNAKAVGNPKRTLSAAARRKISLAQKKRWAAGRKEWKPAAAAA